MNELKKWIDGKSKWNMPVYIVTFSIGIWLLIFGSSKILQIVGLSLAISQGYAAFRSVSKNESD